MAGNNFGKIFNLTSFGESHGKAIGVIVDGCPSGFDLNKNDIEKQLNRRKPNQSQITTSRKESDKVEILSGVMNGKTLGTPITLIVFNKDQKSKDYSQLKNIFRPGHGDLTYEQKYKIRDWRGGGRASARETLARVAAGAIAQKYLKEKIGMRFLSFTKQIHNIKAKLNLKNLTSEKIESNEVRCPDKKTAVKMIELIKKTAQEGDSLGGIVSCVIKNPPSGLGEPVFDKLSADLAKAMMSINAVKGFEIGAGFQAAELKGSQNNDRFILNKNKKIKTKTNNSGGILAGISNGQDITFNVAFKPVPTIGKNQKTLTKQKKVVDFKAQGRHDPCVVPRAVPIVDAMAAITVMDHFLRNKIYS
ncbi:MAG: chorismate synthase [Candidatus Moranbacteria bacterium]|nr:chorismate synthase [Candidatus Moranbacteria bacterium]